MEKKNLQTKMSDSEYLAPMVKVLEIKVSKMLCQSSGATIDDYKSFDYNPF